jgi:hypothetical protein
MDEVGGTEGRKGVSTCCSKEFAEGLRILAETVEARGWALKPI